MFTKIAIIFYSTHADIFQLAKSIERGARSAGAETRLRRVKETVPSDLISRMKGYDSARQFSEVQYATNDDLAWANGIILGTPARHGLPAAQMQTFLEGTEPLWSAGSLIGKVGSAFTSSASQHDGQETTLTHLHSFFLHMGMVVCGVPFSARELLNLAEVSGGTPYGASTITGPKGERAPTTNELEIANFQGKHVADIATNLSAK